MLKSSFQFSFVNSISIVDDDFDIAQLAAAETDLDNYNLGEDLPQIAGIIDDRPAELIAKEDYKSSGKWKTIGEGDTESSSFKKPDSSEPIRNVEGTSVHIYILEEQHFHFEDRFHSQSQYLRL